VHVPPADVEVLADKIGVGRGQLAVVQPAEEERRVRHVLQRFGPAVQLELEVLEAYLVAGHRVLGELENVLAHDVEQLAGPGQVGPLIRDHPVFGVGVCSR
jgi:hypothetical protein